MDSAVIKCLSWDIKNGSGEIRLKSQKEKKNRVAFDAEKGFFSLIFLGKIFLLQR